MTFYAKTLLVIAAIALAENCGAQVAADSHQSYRVYRPTYQADFNPTSRAARPPSRSVASRPKYRLDADDTVAVIVHGVTGEFSKAPIHMPKNGNGVLPAVGHPMVVLRDGTLPMPMLAPVLVRGMTVTQARDAVAKAYVEQEILNKPNQVSMTLMRKRTVTVSVLHDRASADLRAVNQVSLPADRANVLSALVGSGAFDIDAKVNVIKSRHRASSARSQLRDGDIVHVQSNPAGRFFTGGNLRGGQFAIPHGRPLNALQAISVAGGLQRQGFQHLSPREVIVVRRAGGAVRIGYAQLLNNPNALIIGSGDTLIVR